MPLVPIALSGVYDLLPIHTQHFYPSQLTVQVGEPIETKGMTVRQNGELTERLRAAIGEMLGQPAQAQAGTAASALEAGSRFSQASRDQNPRDRMIICKEAEVKRSKV